MTDLSKFTAFAPFAPPNDQLMSGKYSAFAVVAPDSQMSVGKITAFAVLNYTGPVGGRRRQIINC